MDDAGHGLDAVGIFLGKTLEPGVVALVVLKRRRIALADAAYVVAPVLLHNKVRAVRVGDALFLVLVHGSCDVGIEDTQSNGENQEHGDEALLMNVSCNL